MAKGYVELAVWKSLFLLLGKSKLSLGAHQAALTSVVWMRQISLQVDSLVVKRLRLYHLLQFKIYLYDLQTTANKF